MKHIPIRLGPLALLLTVIAICMSTLAVLSFSNSGADMRLAERYSQTVKTRYLLEKDGQEFLDSLSGSAAGGESIEKIFERDGYTLNITLIPNGDGYSVERWQISKIWELNENIENEGFALKDVIREVLNDKLQAGEQVPQELTELWPTAMVASRC